MSLLTSSLTLRLFEKLEFVLLRLFMEYGLWSQNLFLLCCFVAILNILRYLQKQSPEMFYKKDVLRNFAKFTGKYLCQSIFFIKSAVLRSENLWKKRFWHRCFPVNFAKSVKTPQFTKAFQWLLFYLVLLLKIWYQIDVFLWISIQKQPTSGVLKKKCSKNMKQIYRRAPIPKSDFNKSCEVTLLKSHFGMSVLL